MKYSMVYWPASNNLVDGALMTYATRMLIAHCIRSFENDFPMPVGIEDLTLIKQSKCHFGQI
jgi:hypothetical protein